MIKSLRESWIWKKIMNRCGKKRHESWISRFKWFCFYPRNILLINSNTFLFQWNNCLKVTLIRILAMQHSNTLIRGGGLQFFGHTFFVWGGGRIFGPLTWEGLKFLGPDFWNNTAQRPPPPIVYDPSLTTVFYFLFFWPDSGVCWQHRREYYRL